MSKNYFSSPFLHERVFADILSRPCNLFSVKELLTNRHFCRTCIIAYWERIGATSYHDTFYLNIKQAFWNYERKKGALA